MWSFRQRKYFFDPNENHDPIENHDPNGNHDPNENQDPKEKIKKIKMRDDQFVIMIYNGEQCDSKLLQQTNANIKTFFFSTITGQKTEIRKQKTKIGKQKKSEIRKKKKWKSENRNKKTEKEKNHKKNHKTEIKYKQKSQKTEITIHCKLSSWHLFSVLLQKKQEEKIYVKIWAFVFICNKFIASHPPSCRCFTTACSDS